MDEDQGQVLPLLALVVALACVLAGGVARLGVVVVEDAAAHTAADAVALAAAADGSVAADAVDVARANDARVVGVSWLAGGEVRVRVARVGSGEVASARARPGVADASGLSPALRAVLARAEQVLNRPVLVGPGYDGGLSIDVADGDVAGALAPVSADTGLCPIGGVRFTVCAARFPSRGDG